MIDHGRIVLCDPLDSIKAAHRRLTLRFDEPLSRPPALLGTSRWEGIGHEWTTVCRGSIEEIHLRVAGAGCADRGRTYAVTRRDLRSPGWVAAPTGDQCGGLDQCVHRLS